MSNGSDLTSVSLPDYAALENSSYVLAGITFITLVWFWWFLVSKQKGTTILTAAPAEKLLVILGISLAAQYILNGLYYSDLDEVGQLVMEFFTYVSQQSFSLCYIYFCWTRSKLIMQRLYHGYFKYFDVFVTYILPFLMLSPIPVWTVWDWMQAVNSAETPIFGLATVVFDYVVYAVLGSCDLFLLVSFGLFLRKTRVNDADALDPKFEIIAYYSTVSSLLMLIVLITGFVYPFILFDPATSNIFYFVTQLILLGVVWFILILMKVALACNEELAKSGVTDTSKITLLFPFFSTDNDASSRKKIRK